jgi:hypothetical protein
MIVPRGRVCVPDRNTALAATRAWQFVQLTGRFLGEKIELGVKHLAPVLITFGFHQQPPPTFARCPVQRHPRGLGVFASGGPIPPPTHGSASPGNRMLPLQGLLRPATTCHCNPQAIRLGSVHTVNSRRNRHLAMPLKPPGSSTLQWSRILPANGKWPSLEFTSHGQAPMAGTLFLRMSPCKNARHKRQHVRGTLFIVAVIADQPALDHVDLFLGCLVDHVGHQARQFDRVFLVLEQL